MEEIDADTGNIFEKVDKWLDGLLALLPNIGVAIVVIAITFTIAHFISKTIKGRANKRDRESLGEVSSSLIKWAIIIGGLILAITIVVPSIKPADIFASLGVSSVAIGFAFKDILQNMLAGILILIRQPFEVGDQIISGSHEGTVERIETRATFLKTYDGRSVVIPNSDIYTDKVTVNTAFKQRRSQYDIGIGCNDDWDEAKALILEATKSCEGVSSEPAPEVIPIALADFSNNIRLRWWTESDQSSVIHTFGRVLEAVYKKLDSNGIDMPYPTNVMLFHDQTEENDGNRAKQREGWPAGKAENIPKTDRIAQALSHQKNEST